MDKGWMKAPRSTIEYSQGVKSFIEFAFAQSSSEHNLILCPCKTCRNAYWLGKEEVSDHLVSAGFMHGYTSWIHHGEGIPSSDLGNASSSQCEDGSVSDDELDLMLAEGFGMYDTQVLGEDKVLDEELDGDAEAYHKLVNDGSQQLYPGCQKFSKLQFLVRLLNIKNLWGVSNSCFDDLLSLIKDALPNGAALPKNFHDAKKFVKAIGVAYECIDACKNDCILFRKEYADATFCPVCHASRWKSVKSGVDGRRVHKVPQKVVRHFPLKKRLQRLFMSSKTAPLIRWHDEGRTKDAFLRHPADSPAWKHFDAIHPDFSSEVRNIRLGLATDGFNPFGNMNSSYSIWPIILIPYNVPPWLCMKQTNFILSVIVPGKKSPGKDMDVYMQLTIDDLLECWRDGFVTYDVSRSEKFLLRAALLWTISDWIGRGCLSGESLSACSHCLMDTSSLRLVHGHKTCYMGHRRFLDADHKFRFEASLFDGTEDLREPPIPLSAAEISELTKKIETVFGKLQKNRKKIKKRRHGDEEQDEVDISKVFRKRSCLFQLPYWETLLLRHNIDAMHTEKNVFDNIANTFLDVDRRSKDSLNARLDLKEMGIRPDLHPQDLENNKTYIPPAIYSLGPHEKRVFCEVIQGARFPDGYASNFQNKVRADEKRFVGMNSHDCHIIMHDLLPLAIKNVLPEKVCVPLIKLSNYFKELYSKVICVREMQKLEAEIPETLCLLENIFPPAFFDIMVHLTLHLATEVMLAGPVHYRNMYPIERFLSTLKNLVRTRSHPEGAIAEGFLFTESLASCSRYLHGCETKFSRSGRHGDIFGPSDPPNQLPYLIKVGRPLSGSCVVELDYTSWIQAQRYVLVNYPDISSYVKKHLQILSMDKRQRKRDVERAHHSNFHNWFSDYVQKLIDNGSEVPEEVKVLAHKPYRMVRKWNSYSLNGCTFHTRSFGEGKATQCDGVALIAKTSSFSNARDGNPSVGDVAYYGRITEIIELNYLNSGYVVLFKCDWVDSVQGRGVRKDKYGITQVNFKHLLHSGSSVFDEPFILASQATQVYYVQDPIETDWHAVVASTPRDFFDMDARIVWHPIENIGGAISSLHGEDGNWARTDIEGTIVDRQRKNAPKKSKRQRR